MSSAAPAAAPHPARPPRAPGIDATADATAPLPEDLAHPVRPSTRGRPWPTTTLAGVVAVAAIVVLLLAHAGIGDPAARLALLALLPIALDAWVLSRRRAPDIARIRAPELRGSLRRDLDVEVEIGPAAGIAEVAVQLPWELGGPLAPARGGEPVVRWTVVPRRRGTRVVNEVWVRQESPLRLWARRLRYWNPCVVSVSPDLRGPADDTIGRELVEDGEAPVHGVQQAGSELRGLRPFQGGDDPRHVDWKATARAGTPIVREWQPDRQRMVLIALDAGRLMRAEHDGESKFDAALRAMARLALAAETRGDRVGLLVYADDVLRFIPPLSGARQAERLLRYTADVEAQPVESDLTAAVPMVLTHLRRRVLVVVVSDVMDALNATTLTQGVAQLTGRHLAMVALVRDPHLDQALAQPVRRTADAYRRAAADLTARERHDALSLLRARGLIALDLSMRALALDVVRGYLSARWTQSW